MTGPSFSAELPALRHHDVFLFAMELKRAAAERHCRFIVFLTCSGFLARELANTLIAMRIARTSPELIVGTYDADADPRALVEDVMTMRRCA